MEKCGRQTAPAIATVPGTCCALEWTGCHPLPRCHASAARLCPRLQMASVGLHRWVQLWVQLLLMHPHRCVLQRGVGPRDTGHAIAGSRRTLHMPALLAVLYCSTGPPGCRKAPSRCLRCGAAAPHPPAVATPAPGCVQAELNAQGKQEGLPPEVVASLDDHARRKLVEKLNGQCQCALTSSVPPRVKAPQRVRVACSRPTRSSTALSHPTLSMTPRRGIVAAVATLRRSAPAHPR